MLLVPIHKNSYLFIKFLQLSNKVTTVTNKVLHIVIATLRTRTGNPITAHSHCQLLGIQSLFGNVFILHSTVNNQWVRIRAFPPLL